MRRDHGPIHWARTRVQLGASHLQLAHFRWRQNAARDAGGGDAAASRAKYPVTKARNAADECIRLCEEALDVRLRDAAPTLWAEAQVVLGRAYMMVRSLLAREAREWPRAV